MFIEAWAWKWFVKFRGLQVGLARFPPLSESFTEERGLISWTAADNLAYISRCQANN